MNITPLVDVVFLLLVFFMLTSHFIKEPAVKISLPKSETSEDETVETLKTIYISKEQEIYVMDKKVDLENLNLALKEVSNGKNKNFIRIKADKTVDLGLVIYVIDEVKRADITRFSIVTEKK